VTSGDWSFRYDGPRSGREQMELDRSLFESFRVGRTGPVFRLYSWHPPAISLGAHQDPARSLNLAAAEARGVDVVVRPTGGRAIYHDEEITYAVIAGTDDPYFGGSVVQSHAAISRIFARALARLGISAEMGTPGVPGVSNPDARPREFERSPCFSSATRTELTVQGRKILGSAQRRSGRAFLQHGSLLSGDAHLELVAFLPLSPGARLRLREELARKTTTLARETGRVVAMPELIEVIAASLTDRLGYTVHFAQPSPH